MTLVELLMAMTITSILSIVLGGLILAVHAARQHTEGMEEATVQAAAAIDRMKFSIADTGIYQLPGETPVLGLAVVQHSWSTSAFADVLVVWNGGRNGGMADAGIQPRLPVLNELTVYSPDPSSPNTLVEITLPSHAGTIDFRAADFATTIGGLLVDAQAEKVRICDRLRVTRLSGAEGVVPNDVGNVWFELTETPSAADLAATAPQTAAWNQLMWSQGIVGGDFGMRQANVRIEVQIDLRRNETAERGFSQTSIPFFGSASYSYVYQP